MINPALLLLIRLRWRAMVRRTLRGLSTPRGAVMFILGVLLIALWIAPTVIMSMRDGHRDPAQFHAFVPLGMLGMCLLSLMTSAGERAIYFTPGEVEFLFPGPFGRREVLAYKLLGTVMNVALGALIFSAFASRYATSWPAAYVGLVLALVFVQYFTMVALMLGESMSQRAYTKARKVVLFAGAALMAIAAGEVMALRGTARTESIIVLMRESPWLKYVLTPLEPYARAITAPQIFPDLLLWGGACALINLGLFGIIVWLDAEYRETAVRVSQRLYARIQRANRTGMAPTSISSGKRRVPAFPWMGGAGPIARRHSINVMRNARSIVMMLILLSVAVGVPAMKGAEEGRNALATMLTMLAWLTILMTMMVRFDFRTDIEQMDWLKALPISPMNMALGQLMVPVVVCTLMQAVLAGVATYFLGHRELILLVVLFGLPTNLMLFAAENTLFLLMPTRTAAFSPGDFQIFGRQLLFMLVKTIVVSVGWLFAVGAGVLVATLAGGNRYAGAFAAWWILAILAGVMVPCVAWAYSRHDVSVDTPA